MADNQKSVNTHSSSSCQVACVQLCVQLLAGMASHCHHGRHQQSSLLWAMVPFSPLRTDRKLRPEASFQVYQTLSLIATMKFRKTLSKFFSVERVNKNFIISVDKFTFYYTAADFLRVRVNIVCNT